MTRARRNRFSDACAAPATTTLPRPTRAGDCLLRLRSACVCLSLAGIDSAHGSYLVTFCALPWFFHGLCCVTLVTFLPHHHATSPSLSLVFSLLSFPKFLTPLPFPSHTVPLHLFRHTFCLTLILPVCGMHVPLRHRQDGFAVRGKTARQKEGHAARGICLPPRA